jgi:hypothetical protein
MQGAATWGMAQLPMAASTERRQPTVVASTVAEVSTAEAVATVDAVNERPELSRI